MILAIDFDGTLCTNLFPKIGNPIEPVIAWCKEHKALGNKLILWTCRTGQELDNAVEWCKEQGLEFDSVNENLDEIIKLYGGDTRKIQADKYLDDKNILVSEILGKEVRGMKIEVRADGAHISGYVNVTEKKSRPVMTPSGKAVEVIEEKAFEKALDRAGDVTVTVDHDQSHVYASTSQGTLSMYEDSIGLHADVLITDTTLIEIAKRGEIKGWSFGMYNVVDSIEPRANDLPIRHVQSLDLDHLTLVVKKQPVYSATSVEIRATETVDMEERAPNEEIKLTVETPKEVINYTEYENRLNQIRINKFN